MAIIDKDYVNRFIKDRMRPAWPKGPVRNPVDNPVVPPVESMPSLHTRIRELTGRLGSVNERLNK